MSSSIPQTSGVYQILCIPTDKGYVGSAASLYHRKNYHWSMLRRGLHFNTHLQRAWDRYGESAFVFVVLETIPPQQLIEVEQKYIDRLQSYDDRYGFNLRRIANSQLGFKHSELTRQRMSDAHKGRPGRTPSEETRRKLSAANIGKSPSAETRAKISQSHKGKPKSEATRANMRLAQQGAYPPESARLARSKRWLVIDPDGNEQIVISLRRFSLEHGLDPGHMHDVAIGKQHQHRGWKCRPEDE